MTRDPRPVTPRHCGETSRRKPAPQQEPASLFGDRLELAVYLTRITDLQDREAVHWRQLAKLVRRGGIGGDRSWPQSELHALFEHATSGSSPVRVYFGNEFCEDRIPDSEELEASCAAIDGLGLPMTFVTPPVSDRGCDLLLARLTELERWLPGSEVVVSDWGVLRLLRERPSLEPVLGRLMIALLRDPRVTRRFRISGESDPEPPALRRCSLDMPAYRRFLRSHGVRRIELDNLYQGVDMDLGTLRLQGSLYVPFGYVSTGRICLLGNEHLPRGRKFASPQGPCPRPCLEVEMSLTDCRPLPDGGIHTFSQRGNTIFYRQDEELIARGLEWAARQGARLVVQPEIPF